MLANVGETYTKVKGHTIYKVFFSHHNSIQTKVHFYTLTECKVTTISSLDMFLISTDAALSEAGSIGLNLSQKLSGMFWSWRRYTRPEGDLFPVPALTEGLKVAGIILAGDTRVGWDEACLAGGGVRHLTLICFRFRNYFLERFCVIASRYAHIHSFRGVSPITHTGVPYE